VVDIAPGSGVARLESARQITTDNQRIESLSLSRDGQSLAYDSDRGGNADVYRIRVDGGEAVRVTTDPGGDYGPSWSPDARQLFFHSNRTGVRELYSIGIDGSDEQQLTQANYDLYTPKLSLDGTRLFAYAGAGPGSERRGVAFERDANGRWGDMKRVTPPHVLARWFSLSSDGVWFAYVTMKSGAALDIGGTVRASRLDGRDDHLVFDPAPRESAAYVTFGADPNTIFVRRGAMTGVTASTRCRSRAVRRGSCSVMIPRIGSAAGILRLTGGGCSSRSRRTRVIFT
jgi:Tol biopolymer transport system component